MIFIPDFKMDIAGIRFFVSGPAHMLSQDFDSFLCDFQDKPDVAVKLASRDYITCPGGSPLLRGELDWTCHASGDAAYSIYKHSGRAKKITACLQTVKTWDSARYSILKNSTEGRNFFNVVLYEILFRNRILFHQGIIVHASAIVHRNGCILLSAPSGTGKSTQARLWEENFGAVVLNDDHPAVRLVEGEPYVFGTPWAGAKKKFLNAKAPLRAIVLLEQASSNSIRRLEQHEIVALLLPRCFLPYYDPDLMEMAIHTFQTIIRSIPVFLLKCKPDLQAVRIVEETVPWDR